MADPLTCHGWLSANDSAVNNPYNATLIRLTPADMPIEQIITQLIPELVRECSEQAQLEFASTVKRALLAVDRLGKSGNQAYRLGSSCTQAAIPSTAHDPQAPPVKP